MVSNGCPRRSPRIAVAQLGARRNYAIPAFLHRSGLLERFYTDLCSNGTALRLARGVLASCLRRGALKRALDRQVPAVPDAKICSFPLFGLGRVVRRMLARSPARVARGHLWANKEFTRLVLRQGLGQSDTVYVFNGAGLELLQWARRQSLRTVLEQTSAPVRLEETLLREERRRWPGWEYDGLAPADWAPLAEREAAEWQLADTILCGSEYVAEGVRAEGGPAERCHVVPYGTSSAEFRRLPRSRRDRALHVLFVGTVQLRKGIPYLMEAARLLRGEAVRFRAVGPVQVSEMAVKDLKARIELVGPVPRSAVAREYAWADVLVLPSISEGSANVCYEALATGLPVITTPNAGSVVCDGIEGYVVPIRSSQGLAERMATLAADGDLLGELSNNAVARAREFTWDAYAARLLEALGVSPDGVERTCAEVLPTA